jgi:hypothetical protein
MPDPDAVRLIPLAEIEAEALSRERTRPAALPAPDRDTFELFRRGIRSIDILTFDELLERARFIPRSR